ncbi:MAG TPA: ABC transporter ATP-binding protein [Vicinamibacterales bacterium]|jgi:ATP-binding cassette subfamily B protein|nr:ABC transporter ATP-binding protein [Vicinamibacterales bacterium]
MAGETTLALRRLLPYVRRSGRTIAVGLVCVVITTAISLSGPWILKYAIDDLNLDVTRAKLGFYAALLLAAAVVGGLFRFLMRRIIIGASRVIEYEIRNDFFAALERQPLAYFQSHRTGDLMSRATNDLNAVRMMVGPAVMYSSSTLLVFIVAILLMLSIDARLTMVALLPLPLVSVSVLVFGRAIHRGFEKIQEQLSEISAIAQEGLSGVRVVRAYRQESHELERFHQANLEYVDRNRRLIKLMGMFYPSMSLFLGLGGLLVLWLGSREVIRGRITLGEFVAFNSYLVMLSWPMIAFGWVTNMLQRGLASWKRMLAVLDAKPVTDVYGPAKSDPRSNSIEIKHLTFAYGDGPPVLRDVSLSIAPGQTAALIGPTGSGKTTILNLLPRLHEPPPGTVFIGGIDVREIPLAVLRAAIGFIPQEPFLFSDSIAHNVLFGVDAAGDEAARVEAAARVARLDKDVSSFPKGYDTLVGERGITLSGGQKQRTALARALAIDPPILVLDDALSAVDTYTEEEILSRLKAVMRQRTSIIVSHRVSTVREADQIFVLDAGRIVERGSHDELVRRDGSYAALYRKQLLEDELAAS